MPRHNILATNFITFVACACRDMTFLWAWGAFSALSGLFVQDLQSQIQDGSVINHH